MVLYLTNEAVAEVLDPVVLINCLEDGYRNFSLGKGVTPPRIDLQIPDSAGDEAYQLGIAIGGQEGGYAALRMKSDRIYHQLIDGVSRKEKYAGSRGSYLGLVMVFDTSDGSLLAIMQDGLLQRMRVGCDSAIGVKLMARPESSRMALLGSGGMAETHVAAISRIRNLEEVRVFSPSLSNRENFARHMTALFGLNVVAAASAVEAADGADILCSCTNSIAPIVTPELLHAGLHVTAIGGGLTGEASALIDRALRFGTADGPQGFNDWTYEDEALVFATTGHTVAHGGTRRYADIPADREITFADLEAGQVARQNERQITFSQRGNIHGIQFAAVAGAVYELAKAKGAGVMLGEVGGFFQNIRN